MRSTVILFGILCGLAWLFVRPGLALDHVSFQRAGEAKQVTGKVVVEAQDGGLLVLDRTGVLWAITPEEKTARSADDSVFELLSADDVKSELLRSLPSGFRVHATAHYVLCYNTSTAYAQWCGGLFERLHAAFTNYWTKRGFTLAEPSGPMIAFVFDDKTSFANYARSELGEATSSIVGYYSLATNRVTMYDLTGADALNGGGRGSSAEQITRVLSRPEAERTVATVIHEATHQLAFNCGLQTRYADIPLWLSEGIAMYFETPDLRSSKGWSGIGNVNRARLVDMRRALPARPKDSLTSLLSKDDRFRNAQTAGTAYAESWSLVYFLLKRYPEGFKAYMRSLAEKQPLLADTGDERLAEFRKCFGKDAAELDAEFVKFVATLR